MWNKFCCHYLDKFYGKKFSIHNSHLLQESHSPVLHLKVPRVGEKVLHVHKVSLEIFTHTHYFIFNISTHKTYCLLKFLMKVTNKIKFVVKWINELQSTKFHFLFYNRCGLPI